MAKTEKFVMPVLTLIVLVLAVVMFVRGGEVITAFAFTTWNTTEATLTQNNAAPTISGTSLNGDVAITLTGGTTTTVNCVATVTDDNGWGDIAATTTGKVNGTVHQADVTACTSTNNLNCYPDTTSGLTCTGSGVTVKTCTATVSMQWNAEPVANWLCVMNVTDEAGSYISAASSTVNVNSLVAININTTSVDFGSMAPAAISSPVDVNVTNYGNDQIDIKLNGTVLQCASGSMNPTVIKYVCDGTSMPADLSGGANLTTSLATCQMNLAADTTTSGTPGSTGSEVGFRMQAQRGNATDALRGACSGIIWFVGASG